MSVETWETNGAIEGIDQTKNGITIYPSVDELEQWYEEKGELALGYVDQNIRGEAGSDDVLMLPLSYPIELKQIRSAYDPTELQELADRMPVEVVNGKLKVDLENAPTINVMDREHCIDYFEKMNRYHRGEIDDVDIDSIEPAPDGLYYVIVNGHRRIRALKLKCLELGMKSENLDVSFKIVRNLPFAQSKGKQYVENTYVSPTPVEDARAIELHYLFLRDEGEDYSNAALRKVFGYGKEKINDALRFVTAPEKIQEFVGNGLTYTNVVDLVKLREAQAERLKKKYVHDKQFDALAGISDASELYMLDYFDSQILSRLQGKSTADVGGKIRGQIRQIKGESGFTTDSLFIYDEEAERRSKRTRTRKDLGGAAIKILHYLDAQGDLGPEDLVALRELIDARAPAQLAEAVPIAEEDTGFEFALEADTSVA